MGEAPFREALRMELVVTTVEPACCRRIVVAVIERLHADRTQVHDYLKTIPRLGEIYIIVYAEIPPPFRIGTNETA